VKLKDIIQGTRAIHRVRLPLVNVPADDATAPPELAAQRARDQAAAPPGQAAFSSGYVEVGLRVLLGVETQEVLKRAQSYAEQHGSKTPNPGDPLYDFGLRLFTVAIAAVDPESDPRDAEPFFGNRGDAQSGVDDILDSPHIGRDGILYLSEQQEYWQDLCSPQPLKITPEKLWEKVGEVAASRDARPFFGLRPGLQWVLVRFMAGQLVSSPGHRFFFGADSPSRTSPSATTASEA
jgi:hypothetical protein